MVDRELAGKIERVRELMERAGTPAEAEAAAAAFQRLIMRHELSEEEARTLTGSRRDEVVLRRVRLWPAGRQGVTWRFHLMIVLTRFNFCRLYREGPAGADVLVIGTEKNLDAVTRLYQMTEPAFERLAEAAWDEALRAFRVAYLVTRGVLKADDATRVVSTAVVLRGRPNRQSYLASFLLGVPSGLYDKLKSERAEEIATLEGAQALVVVADQELDEAAERLIGEVTAGRRGPGARDGQAFRRGYDAGRSYEDREPVGGLAPRALVGGGG